MKLKGETFRADDVVGRRGGVVVWEKGLTRTDRNWDCDEENPLLERQRTRRRMAASIYFLAYPCTWFEE
tara:strand:+ start:1046 stop:1252 length:207 start_codon:yes stop_codon:yes gene_type:complete